MVCEKCKFLESLSNDGYWWYKWFSLIIVQRGIELIDGWFPGQKKLSKVIVPDKWKEGASNTTESGGRKINENKLLSKKNRCASFLQTLLKDPTLSAFIFFPLFKLQFLDVFSSGFYLYLIIASGIELLELIIG